MFTPSAHLYDTLYLSRGKNYAAEAGIKKSLRWWGMI
jgi:hypothetical protein